MVKKKSLLLITCIYILFVIVFASGGSAIWILSDFCEKTIYILAILVSFLKIISDKWKMREIIICILLLASGVSTYMYTKQSMWMFSMLFVVCMKNVNIDKLIEIVFKVDLIIISVHLLATILAVFGIGSLISIARAGGRIRYTLQFGHPNECASIIFWTQMAWVYLNYKKIKINHILGLASISFAAYMITDTTTSFVCSTIVCMYLLAAKCVAHKRVQSVLYNGTKIILPVLFIFFSLITVMYRGVLTDRFSALVTALDLLFHSRIRLGAATFSSYGYSFFGQYIDTGNAIYDAYYVSAK